MAYNADLVVLFGLGHLWVVDAVITICIVLLLIDVRLWFCSFFDSCIDSGYTGL